MRRLSRSGASWIACLILLGLSTPVPQAHAGKKGSTTPPVYYDVNWLGFGVAGEMNDDGVIVG
jgi:hypothetical protein